MDEITLVGDRGDTAARLRRELAGVVKIDFEPIAQALNGPPGCSMLLDIDLSDEALLPLTKNWLVAPAKGVKAYLRNRSGFSPSICQSMRARRDGHCKAACSFPTRTRSPLGRSGIPQSKGE